MSKRAVIFFLATFAISWSAWGTLALIHRDAYPLAFSASLFALGGLGPTISAYIAVIATRRTAPLSEFHARLFRWRLSLRWYLAALGLPVVLVLGVALGHTLIVAVLAQGLPVSLAVKPWYFWFAYLPVMVLGGGLEELGWRGVALPEIRRSPLAAALIVGVVWALWHLPLFAIPGTAQSQMWFPTFALQTLGLAMLLAWFYLRTGSVLPCILFHASFNAAMVVGFAGDGLLLALISLLVGGALLVGFAPALRSSW